MPSRRRKRVPRVFPHPQPNQGRGKNWGEEETRWAGESLASELPTPEHQSPHRPDQPIRMLECDDQYPPATFVRRGSAKPVNVPSTLNSTALTPPKYRPVPARSGKFTRQP